MSRNYTHDRDAMSIWQVMDYGSVVAHDEDLGIIITVNGSLFNSFYTLGGQRGWRCLDCYGVSWNAYAKSNGLYSDTDAVRLVNIMDEAEAIIERIRNQNAEPDEDIDAVVEKDMEENA